jgi:hypothetical protein
MTVIYRDGSIPMWQLVVVRPEPPGQFTAQVVGIPEVRATAATEEAAIEQARQILAEWLATARWIQVEVPADTAGHPLPKITDSIAQLHTNDPDLRESLEDLAQLRREDLQRTLRELDQGCPDSSSTPTT